MELIENLTLGFGVAFTFQNLVYALVGCLLGTLIGVLPGLGPVPTIAMLLPVTYGLPPVAALIMLAGIYYGAQYGGSTTAILVNLPGESSSVVTVIDGYQMARKYTYYIFAALHGCIFSPEKEKRLSVFSSPSPRDKPGPNCAGKLSSSSGCLPPLPVTRAMPTRQRVGLPRRQQSGYSLNFPARPKRSMSSRASA